MFKKITTMQNSLFTKQLLLSVVFILSISYSAFAQDWFEANNPYGGKILSMHETTDGIFLCGTNRGLYKSADNGETWESISDGFENFATLDVNSTSNGGYFSLFGYTLRRSSDGGQSWETIPAQDWTALNKIVINADDQIFLNTNNSLWRSSDNGDTWTQLETGVAGNRFNALAISPDGELFGSSYNKKILRSSDNGDTWTELATLAGDISSIAFDGDNTVYAISSFSGLFKSEDNGDTWTELSAIPGTNGGWDIITNSSGEVFVAAYDDGIYKSSDGGSTWGNITADMIDPTIRIIFVSSSQELFAGTQAGGVNLNEDNSWVQKNQGITAILINRFIPINGVLYACSDFGVFSSEDGGQSWQQSVQGMDDTEVLAIAKAPNGDLYAGGEMLYRSEDGQNWIDLSQAFPDSEVYTTDLLIEADGRIIMATDEYGMCYSDNQGQTWTYTNSGLEDVTMAFVRKDQDGYYFTADGYNLYRSNDLSGNWEVINNGLTETDIIEFTAGSGALFAISYSDGLFKSTNNGNSWFLATEEKFNNIAVNGTEVYGSGNGVFFSEDNGENWSDISDGLPGDYIEEVSWVQDMGLFANVYGYGLYTLDFSVVGVNDNHVPVNELICYPNPFTETTTVQISLEKSTRITYTLFNLNGQIVGGLNSVYLSKGTHAVRLGKDLLPGFYFVSVNDGNSLRTLRIIKTKY